MLVVRQAGVWALLAAVFALSASASAAEPRAVTVEPNRVYDLPIQSGDQLALQIAADNTRPWLLRVSRVGTYIKVVIDGAEPFSHPLQRFSSDYLYVNKGSATRTRIALVAAEPAGPPAAVELELVDATDLPVVLSSVTDWNREGALAFAEYTEDGRARALTAYQRVERVLYAAEHPILQRIRADAMHAQGEIAFFLNDAALTTERLRTAAELYRSLGHSADEAAALNSLGIWYMDRRQRDLAHTTFDDAWAATDNPILRGQIQFNRCLIAVNMQFLREAETCLAVADELTAAAEDRRFRENVLDARAGVYSMRGEPAKALPILLALLENKDKWPWHRLGMSYNNIALQYASLGDTPAALEYYHLALETNRQQGQRADVALNLRNLGTQYRQLGDLERSRQYYSEALSLSESIGDVTEIIDTQLSLARLDRLVGRFEAAQTRLDRLARLDIDDPEIETSIAIQQAYVALELDDTESAAATIDRIAALFEVAEPNLSKRVHVLRLQADISERQSNLGTAVGHIETAIVVGERMRDALLLSELHSELARLHLARSDLGAAEESARVAESLFRPIRGQVASLDLRVNWGGESVSYNDVLIDVAMRRHAESPAGGYDAVALRYAVGARAQTLAETLVERTEPSAANAELLERRRELLLKVSRFADADRSVTEQIPLRDLLLTLDRLDQELARANPRRADISGAIAPAIDELQAALPTNAALLTVYLGAAQGYGWLLDDEGLDSFVIDDAQAIRQAAVTAAEGLRDRRDIRAPLATLSTAILPQTLTPETERLYVSVDGELAYLPIGLLRDNDDKALVDRYTITNIPTPAILLGDRETNPNAGNTLTAEVFSDPVFSLGDSRFGGPDSAGNADATREAILDEQTWNRLGYSAREAMAVATVFGAANVVGHGGFAATRDALLQAAAKDTDVLHLATHGIVDSARPELTGLMLSRYNTAGENIDGFVGMRDIYSLNIRAPLVVLSACETAIGREVRGEGLLGLSRAFMYAGADEVVASLWQVSDSATATLMEMFYENYAQTGDAAMALATAKRAIQRNPRWRHPYFWAGFVLYGR